jgi:hypothetical protein
MREDMRTSMTKRQNNTDLVPDQVVNRKGRDNEEMRAAHINGDEGKQQRLES